MAAPAVGERVSTWFDDMERVRAELGWKNGTTVTASVASAGADTVMCSVSTTAIAGARYRVEFNGSVFGSSTPAEVHLHLRWANGGAITTSSTEIHKIPMELPVSGKIYPLTGYSATFVADTTGQITAGLTMNRYGGSGNVSIFSDNGTNGWSKIDIYCEKLP
jgi:hypothetical protein